MDERMSPEEAQAQTEFRWKQMARGVDCADVSPCGWCVWARFSCGMCPVGEVFSLDRGRLSGWCHNHEKYAEWLKVQSGSTGEVGLAKEIYGLVVEHRDELISVAYRLAKEIYDLVVEHRDELISVAYRLLEEAYEASRD